MSLFSWLFPKSEKTTEPGALSFNEALHMVQKPPSSRVRGADLMLYMELAGKCDRYAEQAEPVAIDLFDEP
jgi:hypothetical protein